MPSRNVVKVYAPEQVYHVYNRGNNKEKIFIDDEDYAVFLNLLKRHLGKKQTADKVGRPYKNFYDEIELLAFCLMPNHFHLLIYQGSDRSMVMLLKSVANSYVGYFNKRYGRTGRIFQGTYKASLIDEDAYWQHISRYIHLNPKKWRSWEWSSLPYYIGKKTADWIRPQRLLNTFADNEYEDFVADYEAHKAILDELRYVVAD